MTSRSIDLLNIGLIVISLVVAYFTPFALFLVAYAVLGPLHYITEINWLADRRFFVGQPKGMIWAIGFAAFIAVATFARINDWHSEYYVLRFVVESSNAIIFGWLVLALGFVFAKRTIHWVLFIASWLVVSLLLSGTPVFVIIVGMLLPTLVHVYIFTFFFMVYGAMQSRSAPGFLAAGVLLLVPLVIAISGFQSPSPGTLIKDTFLETGFQELNYLILRVAGSSSTGETPVSPYLFAKAQVFISFAYTYHYLNWFSKTTIIGWHRRLSKPKVLLMLATWLGLVGLFAYDYQVGLLCALFFSFLHVFLEFPLNILTIRSVMGQLGFVSARSS